MATSAETAEFILGKLHDKSFTVRKMFGEYALYCNGKTVAFICDDQLYVKIVPESSELETLCEKDKPYPGAKDYYLVTEDLLTTLRNLTKILRKIAESIKK